jgi:hypothetical protein
MMTFGPRTRWSSEEDCLATCDGEAASTHATTSRKKGIIRIARC